MTRVRSPKELLMLWVDDQTQLDVRTKFILDRLARYADADCRAWAPVQVLADATNSSVRTVQYALRDLQASGLIGPTGDEHTLNGGQRGARKVPIYQLALGVEGCDPAFSGANSAPESRAFGCNPEPVRVQTVAPPNELIGTNTLSSESDTRARKELFQRIEAAYPPRGLRFTNRDRAWLALNAALDEGFGGERLVEAAANFARDATTKQQDLGLDYWLHDRKFRGWFDQPKAACAPAAASPAAASFDAPREVLDVLYSRGRDWFGSWMLGAIWDDGLRQVRCPRRIQAETVRQCFGQRLAALGVTVVHHQQLTEGTAA